MESNSPAWLEAPLSTLLMDPGRMATGRTCHTALRLGYLYGGAPDQDPETPKSIQTHQKPTRWGLRMTFLFYLIAIPLLILWIPILIPCFIVAGYKQVKISKKLGVSQTAIEIIHARYTMHVFGLRNDPYSVSLAEALPNAAPRAVVLSIYPLLLAHKITGQYRIYMRKPAVGSENVGDMVPVRTSHIDGFLRKLLPDVTNFVSLGAGMDTRSLLFRHEDIHAIEIDQAHNQEFKLSILETLQDDYSSVCYIPVDFESDDLFAKLGESGSFAVDRPTAYLWEGVTLYLSEEAVRKTLRTLKEESAPGSHLICDFYSLKFLKTLRKAPGASTLEATGEDLRFGLDFTSEWEDRLRMFIESEGLTLTEARFLGARRRSGPFMAVVCISF